MKEADADAYSLIIIVFGYCKIVVNEIKIKII